MGTARGPGAREEGSLTTRSGSCPAPASGRRGIRSIRAGPSPGGERRRRGGPGPLSCGRRRGALRRQRDAGSEGGAAPGGPVAGLRPRARGCSGRRGRGSAAGGARRGRGGAGPWERARRRRWPLPWPLGARGAPAPSVALCGMGGQRGPGRRGRRALICSELASRTPSGLLGTPGCGASRAALPLGRAAPLLLLLCRALCSLPSRWPGCDPLSHSLAGDLFVLSRRTAGPLLRSSRASLLSWEPGCPRRALGMGATYPGDSSWVGV